MGKVPDEFDVDVDVGLNGQLTTTSDMTADVTSDSKMALDSSMSMDTTMRFPDVIRTAMDTVAKIAVTEPIRTEMQMDVKPVVLDLCLNVGLNKLPRTSVKRPYHHCLSVSVLGTELASFSLHGRRELLVDEPEPRPAVAWGSSEPQPPKRRTSPRPTPTVVADPPLGGTGLRIVIDD